MDIFRDSLYGPKRLSSSNAIKNVLLQDHVLQKGEWYCGVTKQDDSWITTASNNFKKPLPALNDSREKIKSVDRDVSSIVLGSSSNHKLPTTSKDFERKWLDTPRKAQPDLGTSIPDFATKYLFNKKMGKDGSIYSSSFNDAKKLDTTENTKERKHHTRDLRSTHFHLGDTRNHYDTETSHTFLPSKPPSENPVFISNNAALETYRSNVFRNGDWNVSGHQIMPYSVTRNDFHIKPFTSSSRLRRQESRLRSLVDKILNKTITADSIRQIFVQYDTDSTGCITKDQLLVVISAYVSSVTQEDIDNLIAQSNSGKADGKIDYRLLAEYIDRVSTDKAGGEEYTGTDHMKTYYTITNNTGQSEDDPSHKYYHINTHFQFGDHHDDQKSVTHSDYVLRGPWQLKPFFALPPLSSQVLPESNESSIHRSTKQSDFEYHASEGRAAAQAREREMKRNQNRLAKQSVELVADHPSAAQAYRQASVSGKDFPSPPADFRPLTPRRAPMSKYRHLDTNGVLLVPPRDPYVSEKQEKFQHQGCLMMHKEKHVECLERTGDNRTSHFILGADSEPKHSEQHHQFSKKTPFDSSVPAAGMKQTAEQQYSHFYPSESAEKSVDSRQSAVREDVNTLQERLKEMNNRMRFSIPRDPSSMDLRKAFLEYDKNLCGKVSPEDFQRACNDLHIYIPHEELEMMFKRLKTDKQGKIDYFQFVKGFTKQLALTRGSKPEMTSIMKSDFCPPEERSFSSAQKRTINIAAKPLTSMDSHYFHYDHSKERAKLTTTGHDFSRPDRLDSTGLSVC